jgi:AraC family transcriptional regulator of adaptative response/methylated-DNA-[protein]-cysteine methyltransferase
MEIQFRTLPSLAEMKKAVYNKDRSYDGIFYVAVRTTNIFCRPSCAARKPLERNIMFYPSARDALFAGYRPCKRCNPLQVNGTRPAWVQKLFELVESSPINRLKDSDLRRSGIEPARARRYFVKNFGMTFHAFSRSRRLGEALAKIREGHNIDDVVFDNGYESHSGFRDAFGKLFGSSPGRARDSECILTSLTESPLGPMILAANSKGLCMAEFSDRRMLEHQAESLHRYFKCAIVPGENEFIKQAKDELEEYFSGKLTKFRVPLLFPGTEFQQKVWGELLKIPYGGTISYEELARRTGDRKASRAVGSANGMNRIGVIIPCHRVVKKDGKLGGYGGGLWRKQWLLDMEKSVIKQRQPQLERTVIQNNK